MRKKTGRRGINELSDCAVALDCKSAIAVYLLSRLGSATADRQPQPVIPLPYTFAKELLAPLASIRVTLTGAPDPGQEAMHGIR